MQKILLVDDQKDMHMVLHEVFDGDVVLVSAYDLQTATRILEQESFALILLDVSLPDGDGFEFCAKLRSQSTTKETPVIFLTGKTDIAAKSIGFSLGAEDYIVKPFDAHEVKLRCTSKIKKNESKKGKEARQQVGDLRFEIPSQRVFFRGEAGEKQLDLTPTGFKLLLYLAQNESHVFSRDQIISAVWGAGTYIVDRTVDTHVGALRKQLNDSCVSIQSVHGHGYKLSVSSAFKKSAA